MNNCIFIVAGEVSGDMFGANLVRKILAINSKNNLLWAWWRQNETVWSRLN